MYEKVAVNVPASQFISGDVLALAFRCAQVDDKSVVPGAIRVTNSLLASEEIADAGPGFWCEFGCVEGVMCGHIDSFLIPGGLVCRRHAETCPYGGGQVVGGFFAEAAWDLDPAMLQKVLDISFGEG